MKRKYLLHLLVLVCVPIPSMMAASNGAEEVPLPLHTHYIFDAHEEPLPNRSSLIYVRLKDTQNKNFLATVDVIEMAAPAGGLTRMDRAMLIAARMQALTDADPDWPQNLRISQMKREYVVIDGKTGRLIMTADAPSMRSWNAPSISRDNHSNRQKYAQDIITNIKIGLKGIQLR